MVKLIVEIIEPYHGRIFDPACGSGGMFVQSAAFVERAPAESQRGDCQHLRAGEGGRDGAPVPHEPGRARPGGDIRQGNTYYDDLHTARGKFDFVMANPPFNVDKVDKERLKRQTRASRSGCPRTDNANYLWIQLFYSALNETGRAGFVMANSASDARGSELEIRRQLIEAGAVDVMVAVGPNFFYTVTLPCTLWFLDRGKRGTPREDTVLFIDARHIYRQIDRAHREFTAGADRVHRQHRAPVPRRRPEWLHLRPAGLNADRLARDASETAYETQYADVPGLCKVATLKEIEAQGWSLNPGRYVGVAEREADDFDFAEQLEELNEELEVLNAEARELEERIAENTRQILEEW